jgi:hypothetical protein
MPEKKVTNGFFKQTLKMIGKKGTLKNKVFVLDTSNNSSLMVYYKYFVKATGGRKQKKLLFNNVNIHMHVYDLKNLLSLEVEQQRIFTRQ